MRAYDCPSLSPGELSAVTRILKVRVRSDLKVMLAAQPVDFRKSVHTLSALVSEALRANPFCGDVFVFRSKRADRVKLLVARQRHGAGNEKWLHQGRFTWQPGRVHLSATPPAILLDGLERARVSPKPVKQHCCRLRVRISLESRGVDVSSKHGDSSRRSPD